ncbi:MAG: hypothetical protein NZ610_03155 [Candidatus Bipolaricaulota bacterium]|nr:hypothetical protein [Candidatus Bipolaricaulota bacterium]MCS7274390.1 hypothetical protein [Candidatus Bipolaricaulota bacterium]MDW8110508.1 hypothetical protein [Candidatus Bipolaricaulota bacterium]
MRVLVLVLVAVLLGSVLASAAEDPSRATWLGTGFQLTFPVMPPHTVPASGLSVRVWIADMIGFDANFFVVGMSLSFTPRVLFKFVNLPLADLYAGAGMGFFAYTPPNDALMLYTPVQVFTGLEMRFIRNVAFVGEVGIFGLGGTRGGVTGGLGVHVYF